MIHYSLSLFNTLHHQGVLWEGGGGGGLTDNNKHEEGRMVDKQGADNLKDVLTPACEGKLLEDIFGQGKDRETFCFRWATKKACVGVASLTPLLKQIIRQSYN